MKQVLKVEDMSVTFALHQSEVHAVRDMNFSLSEGETLAVVGESGSARARRSWPSWACWPRMGGPKAGP